MSRSLLPRYDLYLSFTGGPMLRELEQVLGAKRARPLYCSVDPGVYQPTPGPKRWDLGYMGTYSEDRQPTIETMLIEPARHWPTGRFVVAGAQYPTDTVWPENVGRIEHLPPQEHREFYNAQRFTLNVTRAEMLRVGWSPSVRVFEAAACGTPIITRRVARARSIPRAGARDSRRAILVRGAFDIARYGSPRAARDKCAGPRARARRAHGGMPSENLRTIDCRALYNGAVPRPAGRSRERAVGCVI